MNKIINKFLLVGDKFMPEIDLIHKFKNLCLDLRIVHKNTEE